MNPSPISTDKPLTNPEDDKLGYNSFAQHIAQTVCNVPRSECFVLAIYGPWGSGKTTLLNFIQHYLGKEIEKSLIINFNPWWFSGRGDLLYQFFNQVSISFGKEEKFKAVAHWISKLAKETLPKPLSGVLGLIFEHLATEKSIHDIREEIWRYLTKLRSQVVIIIDDVDRLVPEEIRDLFMVIKAVADFPNTIYLLAFDEEAVAKALEKTGIPDGKKYLEKIVQVPLVLPLPEKTALQDYFFGQIKWVLGNEFLDEIYQEEIKDCISKFLKTMRDVKRLVNALKVTYPLVKGEVNPMDFIAIETLRIFSSTAYDVVRLNPVMFTGTSDTYTENRLEIDIKEVKEFHEKWLEKLPVTERDIVKNLLISIFPKLEIAFKGAGGYGSDAEWRRQSRICSEDIFPRYFRLALPKGDISNYEIRATLELAKDSKAFAQKLLQFCREYPPRISVFFERMKDYIQEIPEDRVYNILQTLFDIGDEILNVGHHIRWKLIEKIILPLLRRLNSQKERFTVLKNLFSDGHSISIIIRTIVPLGREYGRYGANSPDIKPPEKCVISEEDLEKLEKITLERIKKASQDGSLLKAPSLGFILQYWQDLERNKIVKSWCSKVIKSDEGLVDFLVGFFDKDYERNEMAFKLSELKLFVNPSEIIDRCKNLLASPPEWLKNLRKVAIGAFVKRVELEE